MKPNQIASAVVGLFSFFLFFAPSFFRSWSLSSLLVRAAVRNKAQGRYVFVSRLTEPRLISVQTHTFLRLAQNRGGLHWGSDSTEELLVFILMLINAARHVHSPGFMRPKCCFWFRLAGQTSPELQSGFFSPSGPLTWLKCTSQNWVPLATSPTIQNKSLSLKQSF